MYDEINKAIEQIISDWTEEDELKIKEDKRGFQNKKCMYLSEQAFFLVWQKQEIISGNQGFSIDGFYVFIETQQFTKHILFL